MDPLLIFIIAFSCLIILIRWRQGQAEKNLVGTPLPPTAADQDFTPHREGVLLYFYHPRCGPCRSMSPLIDELREKYPHRVEKFNVAEHRDLSMAMGIRATPTTVLVKDNKITRAIIGAKSAKAVEAMLNPA